MRLQQLLPFEDYTLSTGLPIITIQQRIADNISPLPTGLFSFSRPDRTKPYMGKITDESFTMMRIINYKNSFLPVIKGQISSYLGKREVQIKMKLHPFVLALIVLWLGITGIATVGVIVLGLARGSGEFTLISLLPLGMFLSGSLLTAAAFKAESKRSKAFLANLLEGKEEERA